MFVGRVLQQTFGIPIGTNCAPLLNRLVPFLYDVECMYGFLEKMKIFNSIYRYKVIVFSLNKSKLGDYVEHVYPIELEQNTIGTARYLASYLDLHVEIESEVR
jgi:hypothetical protein